jgi:hypothetical protein
MSSAAGASVLEQGAAALAAGRWTTARQLFASALADEESGEALMGLAIARWWLTEPAEALVLEERAYRAFRVAGELEQALNAIVYLCLGQNMTFGNTAAARGWLEEGTRLVADHGLSHLVGWIQLCRAVTEHDDGDPIAAEKWAREAAEGGRRGGRPRPRCLRPERARCGAGRPRTRCRGTPAPRRLDVRSTLGRPGQIVLPLWLIAAAIVISNRQRVADPRMTEAIN